MIARTVRKLKARMRSLISAASVLAGAVCLAAFAPFAPPVAYTVTPTLADGRITGLAVEIVLTADPDGETRLDLPDAWGGGVDLWKGLADLRIEGATEVREDGPAARIVRSRPGARLVVRYRLPANLAAGEPPARGPNFSYPIIGPDGFYVMGETVFIMPGDRAGDRASFRWTDGGAGLTFASDLERINSRRGTVNDVSESVMIAARDLTVRTLMIDGSPLRVAMRGRHSFDQPAFAEMVGRIIAAERDFWGDGKEPFLVTLGPLGPAESGSSIRGTGQGDAFAVIGTPNVELARYRVILTHEYFHSWNPGRMGGLHEGPEEPGDYWFSEGFTDFYARRLALRAGLIDLEQFAADWNEMLAAYAMSPVRTVTNAALTKDFWADESLHKLPYQRGALIAALWQARWSAGGGPALDGFVRAMRDEAAKSGATRRTVGELAPLVAARLGHDVGPDIARYVERGEPIVLPTDTFGACISVRTDTRLVFDRGFDATASAAQGVIVGLDPASSAYAAGLRNGMIRKGREGGVDGDSRVEIGYRIVDDKGVERVIRYRPEGKASVNVQQLEVSPGLDAAARAACARAVAGG